MPQTYRTLRTLSKSMRRREERGARTQEHGVTQWLREGSANVKEVLHHVKNCGPIEHLEPLTLQRAQRAGKTCLEEMRLARLLGNRIHLIGLWTLNRSMRERRSVARQHPALLQMPLAQHPHNGDPSAWPFPCWDVAEIRGRSL